MRTTLGELRELIDVTLSEGNARVSPGVEVTPTVQRVMQLFDATDAFYGYSVTPMRGGGVRVSGYIDGYVIERGRDVVGAYQSVGGDYNIPYVSQRGRDRSMKVVVSLWVELDPSGRTRVTLHAPFTGEGKILFNGRGFGAKAAEATVKGLDILEDWRKRIDDEYEEVGSV